MATEIHRTASYHVWESRERALLFARWSYEPAARALLFVHGLASSWDVWIPFRALIERPELSNTDVFFFDYRSLGTTIPRSAKRLAEVLQALLRSPASNFDVSRLPSTRPLEPYPRIDIVAHSLGSVVTRSALADIGRAACPSPSPDSPSYRVDQLLLAPALLGSKLPVVLLHLTTEALLSAVQFARRGGLSAIMDMREGSRLLSDLRDTVLRLGDDCPNAARACGLVVARTFHGDDDTVVIQGQYADDTGYELRPDGHFSIVRSSVHHDEAFIMGRHA